MQNEDIKIFKDFLKEGKDFAEGDTWAVFKKKEYILVNRQEWIEALKKQREQILLRNCIYNQRVN